MTPPNLYSQQAANRRQTVIVMVLFILFVAFLGYGVDAFILGYSFDAEDGMVSLPLATIAAVLFGSATAFFGLEAGATSVLKSSGAVPVEPGDPKYQQLMNVVEEMAIAAGVPRPQVYVVPDPDPNAFATGKDPQHASIAVTQGLLDRLSREQLQAVVAHEMSHVRNYDIRTMTVVAALVGSVMLLAEFGTRTMRFGGGGKSRGSRERSSGGGGGGILLVIWIIALILAPLISRLLAMAVSRQREYLADASGAELTRNPGALASALEAIDSAVEPTKSIKQGSAHLCIADPLGAAVNDKEGTLADLLATHPPIRKRIALLRAMAYTPANATAAPLPSPGS